MSLRNIRKALLAGSWVFLSALLISSAGVYLFTDRAEKKYKSSAQVFISPAMGTATRPVNRKPKEKIGNHVEAMKTELMGSMVSYRLLLHDLYEDLPFRDNQFSFLNASEQESVDTILKQTLSTFSLLSPQRDLEIRIIDALNQKGYDLQKWILNGDLTVEQIRDSDFILVEFSSENPLLSAFVVNALCEEYQRFQGASKAGMPHDSLGVWRRRADEMQNQMNKETTELSRLVSEGMKQPDVSDHSESLRRYENELRAAQSQKQELTKQIQDNNKQLSEFEKLPQVDSEKSLKLNELHRKIEELNKIYAAGGSKDKDLAGTIRSLQGREEEEQKKFDSESDKLAKQSKEISALLQKQKGLESAYWEANRRVISVQNKMAQMRTGKPEVHASDTMVNHLKRRREESLKEYNLLVTKINGAVKPSAFVNQVKITKRGEPSANPELTESLLIVLSTAGGAGILCIGLVLLRWRGQQAREKNIYPQLTIMR